MSAIQPTSQALSVPDLHTSFLRLLPQIEQYAGFAFRHWRCPSRKADAMGEAVALCWLWFCRLAGQGRHAAAFPTTLAAFAVRAVRSGRRLTGQESTTDAMSLAAQRRRGFVVSTLPDGDRRTGGTIIDEALNGNSRTPVPDQVAFRCDFQTWRASLAESHQRLVDDMALGHRTKDLARRCGITPGRISQLRRQFAADWGWFSGYTSVSG